MKVFIISAIVFVIGVFVGGWLERNITFAPCSVRNGYTIPLLTNYDWDIQRDERGNVYYFKNGFKLYIK